MKILMVSMASSHFFNWVDQLKEAGHEVYWFDIRDSNEKVIKISWVKQIFGWKRRWDYPGRYWIKCKFPKVYRFLQKYNERGSAIVFEQKLQEIHPDLVHSFEMQISCLPILDIMEKYSAIKWVFSSWGSDMYYSNEIGIPQNEFVRVLKRIDYLITDCQRDYRIAIEHGFDKYFLGVFPGNGGIHFESNFILPFSKRKTILIKGYTNEIGKGFHIIQALTEDVLSLLKDYEIIVFGANLEIKKYVNENSRFKDVNIKIYLRSEYIENRALLKLMGKSYIYIGNSLSDGLPNSLIEAMGMGAFPIQSNPGNVTTELIKDGQNGLLIANAFDVEHLGALIKSAISNPKILEEASEYNIKLIYERYNREKVKNDIINRYNSIAFEL